MSTLSYAVADSATMLRRNLRHALRYPSMTIPVVAIPVVMLLLFVYVFGNALGSGVGPGAEGHYVDYVAPGIILMATTYGSVSVAVSVCSDMTEGIVNRFRTLSISRAAVLNGHVLGGVVQTLFSVVLVVGAALLTGFRPNATPLEWLATAGLLTLVVLALTWLAADMGLRARTVEAASNAPTPLTFLPFLGSAIVPTDSMPTAVRWFAEYQPFTPVTETLRGLLMGTEIGNSALIAVAWCLGLTVLGYIRARSAYDKG
ncbi:ABC transporter permease [Streptomyces sp. NPDC093228]|uniref:ABC transporter permease n=1 Tax=unclassified Streptomyces TaxID=2593676 RepID=UPI0007410BD7|nr:MULTISPECIES: ABC transporter permease [unclassified Streptomyces]KUJ40517.1 ABC transporter permease [Streptomyces sp. NRRL F-5122]MDX3260479.1 ABC transporter permease [Streptomyces sp. MI02-2A]REE63300.1 ABC-2 type transport system permease protein [Streptomyces sp. 3212.3]